MNKLERMRGYITCRLIIVYRGKKKQEYYVPRIINQNLTSEKKNSRRGLFNNSNSEGLNEKKCHI